MKTEAWLHKNRYIPAFFLFAFTFAVGWYWGSGPINSVEERVDMRNPANINSDFDFSGYDGAQLESKTKAALFSSVTITLSQDGETHAIELGHFVVSNESGEKEFACGYYDSVVLVFRGEGVASHGHPPEMVVTKDCEISKNVNRLVPMYVPYASIKKQKASDVDLSFEGYPLIQFRHMANEWPMNWYLFSITLKNSEIPDRVLEADFETSGNGQLHVIE